MLNASTKGEMSNALACTLRDLLPDDWSFQVQRTNGRAGVDGTLDIRPPKGPASIFAVEVKGRIDPRDIDRFERLSEGLAAGERLLIVAPHVSARSRQLFKQRNISFLDPTGNAWLSSDSLLIDRTGSNKAPKNDGEHRPRTSLRGPITGRVIRFLCDTRPPLKVRQIATETSVHAGNVSRIVSFLERERLLERSSNGSIASVDWEALLERWSTDLQKDRRAESFLEPRGLRAVQSGLSNWALPYAITGPFASAELAPAAVPLTIDMYVNDIEEAREALSLRRSEHIGNVRFIEAFDRVAFERTLTTRADLILACPTQIAADLLTLPTRSPDEYSELVAWMKQHESAWRR